MERQETVSSETVESLADLASAQGGFTAEMWDRYCALEEVRNEPLMRTVRRHILENQFRVNDFRGKFREGSD